MQRNLASHRGRVCTGIAAILLLGSALYQLVPQVQYARQILRGEATHPRLLQYVVQRDVAISLGELIPQDERVILSGFETPYYQHFGGLRGSVSRYGFGLV